ncbi:MAG TPA: hypothetical protein DEB17_00970 [Chlorobaculum sp.]|uniref:Uncharacterized protein n=1 Tax=Chlorobaculum tepidum (strain ATCC 49652 / DSM 12025 / NBRC 103806 / TLS) TaxID=194439 RepID=Q8KBR4_CHLTE|nr:hypothetical protein CT1720 [Chlorobaculum tepidum TLS]HBU22570.1 hypothetical protein [Chlorobaculum sp.]
MQSVEGSMKLTRRFSLLSPLFSPDAKELSAHLKV